MRGVAGRQIRKVGQSVRHSLVLKDTFDSCRELDLESDRQTNKQRQLHKSSTCSTITSDKVQMAQSNTRTLMTTNIIKK